MSINDLKRIGGALVLLVASSCSNAKAVSAPVAPAPDVSVAEVIAKPLQQWQEFTGRLEARESVEVLERLWRRMGSRG